MEIHVLGSGTAIPAEEHNPAGFLVIAAGIPVLLDMGPGTISRLAKTGISYTGVDFALLTHLHPDHTLDLAILLQDFNSTPGWKRTADFTLVGCKGTREFIDRLFQLYPNIIPDQYNLTVQEVDHQDFSLANIQFQSALTGHVPGSVAYRLEEGGRSLVYSGDASDQGDLAALAKHANMLISECSYPAGWNTEDHLNADTLGRLAHQAQVKSLVVTHRYPPALTVDLVTQIRHHFSGSIQLASDGMKLELN
jgi:ribonuclease BN (tRNA processing enzyme)